MAAANASKYALFNPLSPELRSPDGGAIIHLLLAGISMAADWAFRGDASLLFKEDKALDLAEKLYVKGNIFSAFTRLARSCTRTSIGINKAE